MIASWQLDQSSFCRISFLIFYFSPVIKYYSLYLLPLYLFLIYFNLAQYQEKKFQKGNEVLSDKLKALFFIPINRPIIQTHMKRGFSESGNQW